MRRYSTLGAYGQWDFHPPHCASENVYPYSYSNFNVNSTGFPSYHCGFRSWMGQRTLFTRSQNSTNFSCLLRPSGKLRRYSIYISLLLVLVAIAYCQMLFKACRQRSYHSMPKDSQSCWLRLMQEEGPFTRSLSLGFGIFKVKEKCPKLYFPSKLSSPFPSRDSFFWAYIPFILCIWYRIIDQTFGHDHPRHDKAN